MGLFHVCALQPAHNGQAQIHLLHHVDQALCDGITPYDTTKDIDEDGSYLRIARDEVEGGLDRFRSCTATHVEKVGRCSAIQFDDVHSSHGETGTVNQAADVSIKFDEIETVSILGLVKAD